ncbi:hypothetical protein STEG23_034693 [Scotinomys teguina]
MVMRMRKLMQIVERTKKSCDKAAVIQIDVLFLVFSQNEVRKPRWSFFSSSCYVSFFPSSGFLSCPNSLAYCVPPVLTAWRTVFLLSLISCPNSLAYCLPPVLTAWRTVFLLS